MLDWLRSLKASARRARAIVLCALAVALLAGLHARLDARPAHIAVAAPRAIADTGIALPAATPRPNAPSQSPATPTSQPTSQPASLAAGHLTLQPQAGPPGSTVQVSGDSFTPGASFTIEYVDPQYPPQPLARIVATVDGQLTPTTIVIPASAAPGGLGMVMLSPDSAPQAPTGVPYAVTPLTSGLSAVPDVAIAGATVELDGSGFAANTAMRFTLIDARGVALPVSGAGQPSPGTPSQATGVSQSSVTGSIGPLQAAIPATAAPGTGVLDAVDAAGNVAGIPITIVASANARVEMHLQFRPPRAAIGASVTVECAGFAPDEQVALLLPQAIGTPPVASPTAGPTPQSILVADAFGRLEGQFALPAVQGVTVAAGAGPTSAGATPSAGAPLTGTGGNAGALVSVTLRGLSSGMECTAPLEVAGTALHTYPAATLSHHPYVLVGSGFAANERVSLTQIDDSGAVTPVDQYQAGADGSFTAFEAAPSLEPPGGRRTDAVSAPAVFFLQASGASSGLSVRARLVVSDAPAVILPQVVVAPGQNAQVQGSAFAPHATVVVQANFAGAAGSQVATATGVTDDNGIFAVQLSVPAGATTGPIIVQAQDTLGNQASAVLTINARGATNQVRPRAAQSGQVLTVQGSGFGSGEAIDIFLAQPGSGATTSRTPLTNSTLTVTADALGAFTASYPLPQPLAAGTYLVYAVGELSQRHPFFPVTVLDPAGATPTATPCRPGRQPAGAICVKPPTPTPTPRATPVVGNSILYFADASTGAFARPQGTAGNAACAQARGTSPRAPAGTCAVPAMRVRVTIALFNAGRQPAAVTIAYFLYGSRTGSDVRNGPTPLQLRRSRTLVLAPLATTQRLVNDDIGDGQLASIVVRADGDVRATLIRQRARLTGAQAGAKGARPSAGAGQPAQALDGGSEQAGAPSATWYFPEGVIDGIDTTANAQFAEYLHLLNPDTSAATVRIRVLAAGAAVKPVGVFAIGGGERLDLDLQQTLEQICPSGPPACAACPASSAAHGAKGCPAGRSKGQVTARGWSCSCAIQIESSVPIVAERMLFWGNGPGTAKPGFASGSGSTRTSTTLSIAYASRLSHDQAFLSIADPGAHAAAVTLRVYAPSGVQIAQAQTRVQAGARTTLALESVVGAGIYSLALQSSLPIVAELAQYRGSPSAGATGLLLPMLSAHKNLIDVGWRRADGVPLLWVFNPGAARIGVTLTPGGPKGAGTQLQYELAAHATLRIELAEGTASASAAMGTRVACDGGCVGTGMSGAGSTFGEAVR